MIRYLRYAFLGSLGVVLVSVSLANRNEISIRLMPDGLEALFGFNLRVDAPLFAVALGGIAVGLVIGFVWEWLREHKHRRVANQKSREARALSREVTRLKTVQNRDRDEVLAILDEAG